MDGNTITDNNIAITSQELAQIAHLQAQLDNMDTDDDIDVKDEEFSLKYEPDSEDGLIDTSNIVEVEIETESERISSDEILPDLKEDLKPVLTVPTTLKAIAPKPAIAPQKLPGKANLITAGGQQIVLIQSPGGTANAVSLNTGQPIKIVSQTGQPVTIPQLQAVRQQNVKSDRNVILRTTIPKSVTTQSNVMKTSSSFKRVVPPLQAKKVIVNSNQTNDPSAQLVKIITSTSGNSSILNSPSKTISLAQAQEMGLLTTSQIQQILPQTQGKQIILQSKTQPKAQLIKALPNPIKSPAKILPAPKLIQKQGQQKVIIRQGSQLKTVNTSGQQVLRIPANQLNATSGQIHQINIPGQGIQYVRLVSATSPNTSSVITTTAPTGATVRTVTSNSGTTVQLASQGAQSNKIQNVVPVALVNRISGNSATQNIVKVVPISTSAQTSTTNVRPVAPKPGTLSPSQRILVPTTISSGQAKLSTGQTITTIHASALSQLHGIIPNNSNILMLPAQYVQLPSQANTTASKISTKQVTVANKAVAKNIQAQVLPKEEIIIPDDPSSEPIHNFIRSEPNGLRPRKPCNCTKSQCLKLYCDCFANGEFCYMCNCVNCFNNLENEEERQKAIKSCLERNPHAFRPKIGKGRDPGENAVRKHTKGCNCKRSGCLKNYCECYEAKIACSNNCKCVGCRNIEDSMEKKSLRPLAPLITLDYMSSTVNQFSIKSTNTGTKIPLPPLPHSRHRLIGNQSDVTNFRPMLGDASNKQAFTFMTSEVIEATCQCLLARADEAERNMLSDEQAEKQVLEEFGQCLIKIIQASARTENT